jgi:hypothetical protein
MKASWEKPTFTEISVNGECTAYAGTIPEARDGREEVAPVQEACTVNPHALGARDMVVSESC